ncbi:MFS transporter [Ktedonobacter racemifer]|uniref:Major facilitator superfamily MFS_1 n=1 Tax=Ktedonobacter racemifer DSM 44963 TaxID=485913 RepID=D6TYH5_KTERA|nr:MFS transporter [Ktedonobacter racemifer]EFH83255.1 major facilitator superfamily MFS_1 [Ktedonobacter racemifer DSM 44963]
MQSNTPKKQDAPWRNRDYLLLWSGQGLSSLGDVLQDVPLPLLILALTHSPAQAGIVATLQKLPFPFLSLPAGVLIDRWDRKRVMIICDIGRALAAGSVFLAYWLRHLSMPHIYLMALVCGALATFFTLAETASLPNVVSKEHLPAAMGQNYATSIATGIIGAPLGGLLYAFYAALPFLLNALSYLISVLSLSTIRTQFQQVRQTTQRNFRQEIQEGVAWIWRQPLVRFLAFRVSAGNIAYGGSTLILIMLAQNLHASAFEIGIIFTIDALGGIAASFLIEPLQRRLSFTHITIGLGWVAALLFPLYALAPNIFLLGLIGALMSFALVIFDVTQLSYRASIIPDSIFGRVTSSIRLLTVGAISLGAAIAGIMLQLFGPINTVYSFSAYLFVLALLTTLNKDIRQAGSLSETEMTLEEDTQVG